MAPKGHDKKIRMRVLKKPAADGGDGLVDLGDGVNGDDGNYDNDNGGCGDCHGDGDVCLHAAVTPDEDD